MNRVSILLVALFISVLLINAQDVKKDFYGMWTIDIEGGSVG